jgi:hypothetical protein
MKKLLLFILMFLMVSGCGLFKHIQYVPISTGVDSVYVEHLVRDTVSIEIPGDTVQVIAGLGSESHLETKYSVSDAYVDSVGLHHSLVNKKIKLEKEIVYKEIEKRVEVEKEIPVEVEVPVKYIPDYYKWINIIFWCLVGGFVIFIVLKLYFRRL